MISSLTDVELKAALALAWSDLKNAADTQRDSEWHESCFAATYQLAQEMNKRKLLMDTGTLVAISKA